MLQFHLQATGVQVASQWLSMPPHLSTIVVLALISRNPQWIRVNMPASWANLPSRLIMAVFPCPQPGSPQKEPT